MQFVFLVLIVQHTSVGVADDAPLLSFVDGVKALQAGDPRGAFKIWKQLAQGGDKDAMYNVGLMYHDGFGINSNADNAAEWYQKAAQAGHAAAANNLAVMYSTGRGYIIAQYDDLAIYWYKFAAGAGNVNAIFNLAVRYPEQSGGSAMMTENVNKYRELALLGSARAHQRNYLILR
jgi:TPR repeat protein